MMPAERIPLSSLLHPEHRAGFKELAEKIAGGAVFVYPTETIYGIGGRFDNSEVYRRIIAVKRRPSDQPMILVTARRSALDQLDISFPPAACRLAEDWWPGPLTLVLPSAAHPEGIAVRVSDHPFLAALAPFTDVPLFSTSANISGAPYNPDPGFIYSFMKDHVDFMIDAGMLPAARPSTVVRVTRENVVTVVREGGIPVPALQRYKL
jgi:L-threonylcarbamoyladenylate synthase